VISWKQKRINNIRNQREESFLAYFAA
jgi:hypothetical protein